MKKESEIIISMTGLVYPLIILFGLYIILNGDDSPGGGFQGGAVLASVFISRYLVDHRNSVRVKILQISEKILFLGILMLAGVFIFYQLHAVSGAMNLVYLKIMNMLIGLKVFCGLTIIFVRFAFWENE
ncbi:MAG: MnhB domain-containing protein [Lachnospiraceae bacterium]